MRQIKPTLINKEQSKSNKCCQCTRTHVTFRVRITNWRLLEDWIILVLTHEVSLVQNAQECNASLIWNSKGREGQPQKSPDKGGFSVNINNKI